MLKLAMNQGEFIKIGEDIKIQLAADSVNRVNILIDAPKELNIKRTQAAEETARPADQTFGAGSKKSVIIVGKRK